MYAWSLSPQPASAFGPKRRLRVGHTRPLCPSISDINLFRYCQGIVHLDAEMSNRAFNLGVAKQELDGPEIAGCTGRSG